MRFKRASDSHTYAILWWAASLLLYMWLVYYGFSKVKNVASRDFFTQTKAFTMSPEQMFGSFPDVMICTGGYAVVDIEHADNHTMSNGVNYKFQRYQLVSVADLEASPCIDGHDRFTIFSVKDPPSDVSHFQNVKFNICPRNITVPGNYSTVSAYVFVTPRRKLPLQFIIPGILFQGLRERHGLLNPSTSNIYFPTEANPYARADGSLRPIDWLPSLALNSYYIHQDQTYLDIYVEPKATKVIGSGIWGLLGASEAELEYSLSSSSNSLGLNSSCSLVDVYISPIFQNDTQILVTSIPGAFADWGGAFSAAWAVFYLFFGAPRVDPFGVISRLISRKTQRCVTTLYGYWSWSNKPQESTLKNTTAQRAFTTQHPSINGKTTQDMHGMYSKESSSALLDVAALDTGDVVEREKQDKDGIEVQVEQTPDVKELKADFDNLQKDFCRLHRLLKDYYLEMDLTETETETETESLPPTDDRRWYRRFWPSSRAPVTTRTTL